MGGNQKRTATLAVRLREALDVRRLRAVDLCEMAGVPKSAVSYYLAGTPEPRRSSPGEKQTTETMY